MQTDILLKNYTTMRLGGSARGLFTLRTREELLQIIPKYLDTQTPILLLGDGSNLIARDTGFGGIVILNRLTGFEVIRDTNTFATIKIAAGESWDVTVQRTAEMGLSGIENLSGIPGRVGAAPIQNIGAYGQEIANTLIELEAYDTFSRKIVVLSNKECNFSYRQSIFNTTAKRRYIVLSITLQLSHTPLEPPFYQSLQSYLEQHTISDYSPTSIRDAVIAIRSIKLPDPKVLASAGSFFKNPIVEKWVAEDLQKNYDSPPVYEMGNNMYKISAGWLIEQAGLKGFRMGGMKVYDKNALVLVNESASSYEELARIREHIVDTVRDRFRINLVQEPEEVGL